MGEPTTPEVPPSASQSPTASGRFTVVVAFIAALIAAIAITATFIGYSEWKSWQPNIGSMPGRVIESMNQSLSDDEQFRDLGLYAESIQVVRAAGNMFEGQAIVSTRDGKDHSVFIHITYNGDGLLWRTDPGAFLFTVQDQLQGTP
jgi:hypothetical protein